MKIAIIGGGHIGGACAFGLKKAAEVTVTARSAATLAKYEGTGIEATADNAAAVKDAQVVMFCVKTAQMQEAVNSVKGMLDGKIVVSMAAQVTPAQMQEFIGEGIELAYVIPNTAAALGQSMTFISSWSASEESVALLAKLFDEVGKTAVVPMTMLPAGIALASCGIGYALEYIAASVKGGVRLGFSRDEAEMIVTQTVLGAALVQEASSDTPEQEVRKVATPGGLTEKGVNAMEAAGFTEAVIAGLCR